MPDYKNQERNAPRKDQPKPKNPNLMKNQNPTDVKQDPTEQKIRRK